MLKKNKTNKQTNKDKQKKNKIIFKTAKLFYRTILVVKFNLKIVEDPNGRLAYMYTSQIIVRIIIPCWLKANSFSVCT